MNYLEATKFTSLVFHAISTEIIKSYKEDLFFDITQTVQRLSEGESVVMFSRKTGSDLDSRFAAAIKGDYEFAPEPTLSEIYAEANHTLGWSVMTILKPDRTVAIRMNDTCQYDKHCGGRRIDENGNLIHEWRESLLRPNEPMRTDIVLSRRDYEKYQRELEIFGIKVERLN